MDIYEEAARAYESDCMNADREREQVRREEKYDPILPKMMGSDFEKFFEVQQEINKNHALDCAF